MSFIRKNKFVIIAIGVFLILVILAFQVVNMFFPEEGKALYGNRLDGIEEVKITDSKKEQKAWETLVDRAINNKKATPLKEPKEKAVEKEAPKAQEASEVSETQED